ncbi:MAG TPA: M67 family metallopeptidase [Gammaproteobacteria bacterium]|nr:M67 family metallopeptidase [Gammaproteobacteria bacterium]
MPGLFDRSPPLTRLRLPAALHAELIARARASPAAEVCGLLGGRGELATRCYPLRNVAEDPALSFLADPREQLAAMRRMRERDEALLGIYHSHPTGPATPSARDRALAAYPGIAYLIVSLAAGAQAALGSFVFEGEEFAPLALEIV